MVIRADAVLVTSLLPRDRYEATMSALVTGAAQGIGLAISKILLRNAYRVSCYINPAILSAMHVDHKLRVVIAGVCGFRKAESHMIRRITPLGASLRKS